MAKVKLGQVVYLRPSSSLSRLNVEEVTVTRVGRKYFQVSGHERLQFDIETMKDISNYGHGYNWTVYFSRQEIDDEDERARLIGDLKKVFGPYETAHRDMLTLDRIRAIHQLVFSTGEDSGS